MVLPRWLPHGQQGCCRAQLGMQIFAPSRVALRLISIPCGIQMQARLLGVVSLLPGLDRLTERDDPIP